VSSPAPFEFKDCALIGLSVGKTAHSLRELRDRLGEVPPQSLWHHFFESLLRPAFDDPEYPNDFALWAKRSLHDDVLAERLGVIDPVEFEDVEHLRQHLVDVVEDRLSEMAWEHSVAPGHEFYFLRSQVVVVSSGISAASPRELGQRIRGLPTGSIFFHVVDARRRSPLHVDDFSVWLEAWGDAYAPVREQLARARMHQGPLSELRERIADCFALLAQEEPAC
jgi:hypothetical protein